MKEKDKEYQKLKVCGSPHSSGVTLTRIASQNQYDSIKRKALLGPNSLGGGNNINNMNADGAQVVDHPAQPRVRGLGAGAAMADGISMGDVAQGMDANRASLFRPRLRLGSC